MNANIGPTLDAASVGEMRMGFEGSAESALDAERFSQLIESGVTSAGADQEAEPPVLSEDTRSGGAEDESKPGPTSFLDELIEYFGGSEKSSCEKSPLYESALNAVSDYFYEPSRLDDLDQLRGKYNCQIKTHEDAVRYANEALSITDDVYTRVLSRQEVEQFEKDVRGDSDFSGIGIVMGISGSGETAYPTVMMVFPGSPAEQAGIARGDLIVQVDGDNMRGKPVSEVSDAITGLQGSEVRLKIDRGGRMQELVITRGKVEVPSVIEERLANDVLYVRLIDFINDKTDRELARTLLSNMDMKGLIIDIRGNPGGRVEEMFETISLIVDEGEIFRSETRRPKPFHMPWTDGSRVETSSVALSRSDLRISGGALSGTYRRNPDMVDDVPVVVLVDEHSGSASELFAGALKDNGEATLVGETTFGKGIGQSLIPIEDGAMIAVTDTRYNRPNGAWIGDGQRNRIGVKPDVEVVQGDSYVPLSNGDLQFQKAIEIVESQIGSPDLRTDPPDDRRYDHHPLRIPRNHDESPYFRYRRNLPPNRYR